MNEEVNMLKTEIFEKKCLYCYLNVLESLSRRYVHQLT